MNRIEFKLGDFMDVWNTAISEAEKAEVVKRIWGRDTSLWKNGEAHEKIIRNSLGWLTVADEMMGVAADLSAFADLIRARGFKHVMVCGMGGSSLCPEVLAQTFGRQAEFPQLLVLDSTDPDVIAELLRQVDVEHCLFVIASKSGTTTEPTVFYKFWYDQAKKLTTKPGANFVAITDPGSPLAETASKLAFQKVFLNQPDIGGRYSALSYFGMVPAALMGLEVKQLLSRARQMSDSCSAASSSATNPGLRLGLAIAECANRGRDKLTLVIDESIASLGLWIEQLLAESTGKEGKGILPVSGEQLGEPMVYGDDRIFVSISVGAVSSSTRLRLEALEAAGHPVVYRELTDQYDLGSEFFLWEFATACIGWRLQINPFDQPNVQEAKDATRELLSTFVSHGRLLEQDILVSEGPLAIYGAAGRGESSRPTTLLAAVRAHLKSIKPHDYIAFLNYIEETPAIDAEFASLRLLLRESTRCATTVGYGPRFLHSTGQLHKGGPDTGVFFQITANDATDFAIPGEQYTFSILKQAQALGDFRALTARGRRAMRIDLGDDVLGGIRKLRELIAGA